MALDPTKKESIYGGAPGGIIAAPGAPLAMTPPPAGAPKAAPADPSTHTLAKQPGVATVAGGVARDALNGLSRAGTGLVNMQSGGLENVGNLVHTPFRHAAGMAEDFGRAATGMPARANAGEPVGSPIKLPRFTAPQITQQTASTAPAATGKPAPAAKPAAGKPAAGGGGAAAPVAAPPPPKVGDGQVATAVANSPVLGTFNGRAITQADSDRLSGKLPTATGPVATGPNGSYAASTDARAPGAAGTSAPLAAAPAQLPSRQPVGAVIGAQSAAVPLDELERRRQIAITYEGRGSPDARRAINAAYQAEAAGRRSDAEGDANRAARLAEQDNAAAIAAAATQQTQAYDANKTALTLGQQQRQFDAKLAADKASGAKYVADKDGRLQLVDGGTAAPVLDANGNPLQQATTTPGQVTQAMQFEALNKQYESAMSILDPTQRSAELARIQSAQQALLGGTAAGTQSPPAAGTIRDGYRFKGGNPSDKSNWEPVR